MRPSAVTAAGSLTWANGPAASTASLRRFWIRKCSKISTKPRCAAHSKSTTPKMNDRPAVLPAAGRKTLWAWAVGTFFGVGRLKPGPGTWGSIAATLLWGAVAIPLEHHAIPGEEGFGVILVALPT